MISVVFLGTPDFAVPSLAALIANDDINVQAVITQPDKPVGRKKIITAPPVKNFALEHGLEVLQSEKISRDQELISKLKNLNPDFLITVAYGQILKTNILELAPVINVHASLLPEFRGPAPINWALIHGDQTLGVTTMLTNQGVDTGDILLKAQLEAAANETAETATANLAQLGAELLVKTLLDYDSIKLQAQEDTNNDRQLSPFMDRQLGEINFQAEELKLGSANPRQKDFQVIKKNTAENIYNLYRGTYPWPGIYFNYKDQKITILDCDFENDKQGELASITKIENGAFAVQCQEGILWIKKLKPQGKSEMLAADWLNGQRLTCSSQITCG